MRRIYDYLVLGVVAVIGVAFLWKLSTCSEPQAIRPERTHYSVPAPDEDYTLPIPQDPQRLFTNICPPQWYCINVVFTHHPPKSQFVAGRFEFSNREPLEFAYYATEVKYATPNRMWELRALELYTEHGKNWDSPHETE